MGKGKGKGKSDVQACLVRPEAELDGVARGEIRLRSKIKKGAQQVRFDIKARKVAQAVDHELWLEDGVGSDVFELVDLLAAASGKSLSWSANTADGDALPLDAADAADLVGRRVEIRSLDDVVLAGRVPALDASKKPSNTQLQLELPEGASPGAKGRLKLRAKADRGQQRFHLHVRKLAFSEGEQQLFVETAPASDVFESAGLIDRLGASANGRFRRDCKRGDPLPVGAEDLAELEGRRIQVRDDLDQVVLEGVVPAL
jgi:hypothetical protein